MLVSCILTSCNRPRLIRQALQSVADQTYKNYEVLVVDDSDPKILDIVKVLEEFKFPRVRIWPWCGTCFGRRSGENRLAIQINRALREEVQGDLICYLPDDDFFFPEWFAQAVEFFAIRPNVIQAFGSLHYTTSMQMDFRQTAGVRFFDHPIYDPMGSLDHGQVMHYRRIPPALWPEAPEKRMEPDGHFFRELALDGAFWPIMGASAVMKRLHPKNYQRTLEGDLSGPRE